MTVLVGLVAFSAIGSAVLVRAAMWPTRYWWPVFGYVTFAGLAGWWASA